MPGNPVEPVKRLLPPGVPPLTVVYVEGVKAAGGVVQWDGRRWVLTDPDDLGITSSGGSGSGAPTDATYVVVSLNGSLTGERVLAVSSPITLSDGGAGGNITITFDQTVSLNNNARVAVRANSTGSVHTRRRLNFIPGAGTSISIADDSGNEEVDVTITVTGSGGVSFADITDGENDNALMVVKEEAQIRFDTLTACLFKDPLGDSGFRTCALAYQPAGTGDYGFTVSLPSITGTIIVDDGAQNITGVKTFTVRPTFADGFKVTEGTDEAMGVATLTAGTVTVNTAKVTANSRIFLTGQNSSGTHGELTVSARSVGVSFTITSSSGSDTRSVAWLLVEPS